MNKSCSLEKSLTCLRNEILLNLYFSNWQKIEIHHSTCCKGLPFPWKANVLRAGLWSQVSEALSPWALFSRGLFGVLPVTTWGHFPAHPFLCSGKHKIRKIKTIVEKASANPWKKSNCSLVKRHHIREYGLFSRKNLHLLTTLWWCQLSKYQTLGWNYTKIVRFFEVLISNYLQ